VEVIDYNNYTVGPSIVLSISMLCGVFLFCGFIYMARRYEYKIDLYIQINFFLGTELMIIATVFWYITPYTIYICQLRIWLTTMGLMILNGISVSKSWQLVSISKMKVHENPQQVRVFFTSTIITSATQLIFLTLWAAIDPFTSKFVELDELLLKYEFSCTSKYLGIWLAIQFTLLGLLTIWGIFTAYYTWKLTSHYDPRFNLFTLYFSGVLIIGIACVLLTTTFEYQVFYIMTVGSVLLTSGFFIPHSLQFIQFRRKSSSQSKKRDNNSTGARSTGGKSTKL
jgi:hypothetical protein